jgi:hypothetical protein
MTQDELKMVLEALRNYAWHGEACPQHPTYSKPENYPKCTCGYDKAITAIKEALAQPEQEPVASLLVECVMSARKEFIEIKGESQFCTECHAFERADSWWQEWHGGDIDYIIGAKYTHPPQRTEPVIDQSAAIRIATALGWTPPRTWVGLTEARIEAVWKRVQANDFHDCVQPFAEAIEAELKEKNNG